MQSKDFRDVSYEEELQRAKWYKEDLDKGGWSEIHKTTETTYWMKIFPEEEVPIKTLMMWDLPVPVDKVEKALNPSNTEIRKKWDEGFSDHEVLKSYSDGSYLTYLKVLTSFPLADRSFVMYNPPVQNVHWYGKEAKLMIDKNGWDDSKPAGEDGCVRATNGGNLTIFTPDEKNPTRACKVFALRNSNYNGWIPQALMRLVLPRSVPRVFDLYRKNIIEACNKYF